jgi:hypothetical protein
MIKDIFATHERSSDDTKSPRSLRPVSGPYVPGARHMMSICLRA